MTRVSDENIEFLIDMYSEHKDSCQASSITYLAILELQAYRALMPKVREAKRKGRQLKETGSV